MQVVIMEQRGLGMSTRHLDNCLTNAMSLQAHTEHALSKGSPCIDPQTVNASMDTWEEVYELTIDEYRLCATQVSPGNLQ